MREYTRGHVHMQVGDENFRAAFPVCWFPGYPENYIPLCNPTVNLS